MATALATATHRASQRAFVGVSALVFAASAAATIFRSASMSSMGSMPMPGGWSMSTAWMRMPGQTWLGGEASFVAMWAVMMTAMMSPVLVPALVRYREVLGGVDAICVGAARVGATRIGATRVGATRVHATRVGAKRLGAATALAALGYFFVWTSFGAAIFPLGALLAELAMRLPWFSRMVPLAVAAVVLIAGGLQLTPWKARCLACCRSAARGRYGRSIACGGRARAGASGAWRYGVGLGLDCCRCCAGLTATLLVVGVMDLRVMAAVTAAVMVERLGRRGVRAARAVGAVLVAAGLLLLARAGGLI